jgi:hypothetical protein
MLQPSYWTAFTKKAYKWAYSWVSPPHQMGYIGLILLTMGSASYFSLSPFTCISRCSKTATSEKIGFNKNLKKCSHSIIINGKLISYERSVTVEIHFIKWTLHYSLFDYGRKSQTFT